MKSLIARAILAVMPFFAAFLFACVFVELLGFGFVSFSNWYLSIIIGIQTLFAIFMIGAGLQEGNLGSIFVWFLWFFVMSLLALGGLSVFQYWFSIPFTPHAFSVVHNYQHEMNYLTHQSIALGYDPHFRDGMQRELVEFVVFGIMNLILSYFRPSLADD